MSGINDGVTAVILLNWNGYSDTAECVKSLVTNDPKWKIYIVDNASANNEAQRLQTGFPEIIVLPQTENHGFCEGNNIGIRQAIKDGAEYVIILNNDTIVSEQALTKLLGVYKSLPAAGAISPVILEYPEINKVWFAEAKWDTARAQFSLNPAKRDIVELLEKESWTTEFACGCCLLASSKVFKEVGLLDPRYFAYYDEADWCKRLEKKGYKSYTTSKSFIYHKVSKTTPGLVATYLMTRNRLLWMKENLPFSKRILSFSYLNKEFLWHFLNNRGWVKGIYSPKHSKAYLRAVADYRRKRFGRWNDKTAKIIFNSG